MIVVESAGITDVGRRRESNEDAYFLNDDMRLYVVADGMGGHKAGEVASKMVVEVLRDHMKAFNPEMTADDMDTFDSSLSKEANYLVAGIHRANRSVYQHSQSSESYQGMGSTVSAIYLTGNTLIVSNVGDSPVYLIRKGAVENLYVPHTWAAEHAAIAPKGAKPLGKQFRHMLTRAVGVEETVKPDTSELQIHKDDIMVICSDGLSDNVSANEIRDIVLKKQPDQACRALVDLSNERRGHDNITVIVLKIKEVSDDGLLLEMEDDQLELKDEISREKTKIAVEYDTEDGSYQSFVRSINRDGVFIETGESFSIGQDIMMTFSVGEGHSPFMITGKVISRSPEGIEVKFEPLSPDEQEMIKTLIEKSG